MRWRLGDLEGHPYPSADVLARWVEVLAEPAVHVEVVDGAPGCDAVWPPYRSSSSTP